MFGLKGTKWGIRRKIRKLEEAERVCFGESDIAEARRMEDEMAEAYILSKLNELKQKREDRAIMDLFIAVNKNDVKAIGDACDVIKAMGIIDSYK